MDELIYWLALHEIRDKIDVSSVPKMIEHFGSIEGFWKAGKTELTAFGWDPLMANTFIDFANKQKFSWYEQQLYLVDEEKIRIVKYTDEEYPPQLKLAKTLKYQPPLLLFVKGNLRDCKKCVAVVGTRNASHSALTRARQLSKNLAKNGYTIVSGLARGIDHEAHCGALDVEGKTIATLAWMVPIYPDEHTELAGEIERHGAIISELFKEPRYLNDKYGTYSKSRFVVRNRIISGISNFVVAVESGPDGGTIRQVDLALSQKKPVYVLEPENDVSEEKKIGYRRILGMGAKSIIDLEDITNINHFIKF